MPVKVVGNQSEVACILTQIAQEYEAGMNGLTGLAVTARHSFITARMENMSRLHQELEKLVGENAGPLVATRLDQVQGGETDGDLGSLIELEQSQDV